VLDELVVLLYMFGIVALDMRGAALTIALSAGILHFALARFTDYPRGTIRRIPFRTHALLELAEGVLVLAATWALCGDERAAPHGYLTLMGVTQLGAFALSDYRWPLASGDPKPRRRWLAIIVAPALLIGMLFAWLGVRYGGGARFPDRVGNATMSRGDIEIVAALPTPPGNIAVSRDGRVFFTMHPEAQPSVKLVEYIDGEAIPYPDAAAQEHLVTPLGVRIDRQDRLWVLDHGLHGLAGAKLLAYEIASGKLVHEHEFSSEIAGVGSMVNDLAVHPDGNRIYIAESSVFGLTPALLAYDVDKQRTRRLLERHFSTVAEPFVITADGEPVVALGVFSVRPGVDSIALDRRGDWLYFAAMTARSLYRLRTRDLDDTSLNVTELGARVEAVGEKPVADGITSDDQGNLYLGDPEHNAVVRMTPTGQLETLLSDPLVRWPDGFGFGPDGWLYITCSGLQHVIMQTPARVAKAAPYHVLRFRPGVTATAGH